MLIGASRRCEVSGAWGGVLDKHVEISLGSS